MILHDLCNRAARSNTRATLGKLLETPVERDRFVSHLYQSRREYR